MTRPQRVLVSGHEGFIGSVMAPHLSNAGFDVVGLDTGYYRDNLASGRPSVWVALPEASDGAGAKVQLVTIDPYEGEGIASDVGLVVEAVPMPDALRPRIEAFIAAHHVDIHFKKRERQPVDVAGDRRAPRILGHRDKWEKR